MLDKKIYYSKPLVVESRRIYPLVLLKVLNIKNTFLNVDFGVLALKIIEKENVYYINISMKKDDFEKLVKSKKINLE